jgi:hypothetical protein
MIDAFIVSSQEGLKRQRIVQGTLTNMIHTRFWPLLIHRHSEPPANRLTMRLNDFATNNRE